MKRVRKRCTERGCDSMASSRGWCPMHYKRWQLWGDPSVSSRTAAALALAMMLLACSTDSRAPDQAAPVYLVPAGFVLVPRNVADEFAQEINDLRDDNQRLELEVVKWKTRRDCT